MCGKKTFNSCKLWMDVKSMEIKQKKKKKKKGKDYYLCQVNEFLEQK